MGHRRLPSPDAKALRPVSLYSIHSQIPGVKSGGTASIAGSLVTLYQFPREGGCRSQSEIARTDTQATGYRPRQGRKRFSQPGPEPAGYRFFSELPLINGLECWEIKSFG